MWCAGRNGRKERKHDNACGGASGLGKANPKSCEGKGTEEMLSSKRRGFGHVCPWNYRLFYFVNSFFWVPFLAFAGFCFCCFLLFRRCSLCCFCRAECFFLVRLSLLLFFCLCTLRCSGRFWCFTPHFEAAAQEKEWTFCVWGGGAAPSPPTPSSFEMLKVIA